jgi:hypothetical protein
MHTNKKTVARTSEGLLDMLADYGGGGGVGVTENLLSVERSREFASNNLCENRDRPVVRSGEFEWFV